MKHKLSVGKIDSIREGDMRMIRAGGKEILVVKVDGKFFAIDGWCSHMRAPLDRGQLVDHAIRCRVHGAVFDLQTGKVLMNAQAKDLRTYPILLENGDAFVIYEENESTL
ncbi:MAG: Rieske (2Fe-2S) protein [Methanomassiliicoccales archaeon]